MIIEESNPGIYLYVDKVFISRQPFLFKAFRFIINNKIGVQIRTVKCARSLYIDNDDCRVISNLYANFKNVSALVKKFNTEFAVVSYVI